ncbi:MAG: hypothetical protein ACREFB_14540, partial [Stellaceae bacterium]
MCNTKDVPMTDVLAPIAEQIRRTGFAYMRAPEMTALLTAGGLRAWERFARTWGDLGVDLFMAEGGRYRRRR